MLRLPWSEAPNNLRDVIRHLLDRNVFWRYTENNLDFTIGHFATKMNDCFYTSYRNDHPSEIMQKGLIKVAAKLNPLFESVVHFHSPMKSSASLVHGDDMAYAYFDNHGPNIYFNRDTKSSDIIDFIDENFDLTSRTTAL